MNCYLVPKEQNSLVFVFLRIMILNSYILKLRNLQNQFQNNTEMFFYLIFKYYQRLYELSQQKSSSKKKYQEVTKNYENIGIRVAPAIHQILKTLSDQTGYSMSAIVRFLIEWECLDELREQNASVNNQREMPSDTFLLEIVITEIEIHHWHHIFDEVVKEDLRWGFS